jgi:ATP-dependent DNA helicase RecQ
MAADAERLSGTSAEDVQELLQKVFSFQEFREGQEAVVRRLLDGRSVLAVFPTGSGKSLCYQLPSLLFDGLTVVISPLIALMKDQLDFLIARGVPAARLDSTLSREEYLQLYDDLHAGRLKLLYISPERLGNERFLETIRRKRIALLTIDEAHCISEWGHNFRPDYLKIARLARDLDVERVLALTATATPEVSADIQRAFSIDADDLVHTGFYRPNLRLHITPCARGERDALLLSRLRERPAGPAIVYVTLQKTAENVAAFLAENDFDASAYHAGMKTEERTAVQNTFMASKTGIIVATIAFGMGVDKKDIRYIYHYNLPKGLESYMQETGRAGRDGLESICEMFVCPEDAVILENFSYGDTPDMEAVEAMTADLLNRGDTFDVSVYSLSSTWDVRPLVVKTLLTYLELKKIIQSTGAFYTQYRFQPRKSSAEIFRRVGPERAEFLRKVFRHARKGKTWFSLDPEAVSRKTGEARDRIIAALGYLDETGDLEVEASGVRQGYRRLEQPASLEALCAQLNERFQRREESDIGRIREVLKFAEHDGCFTRYLLAFFGADREDCGHCAWCEAVPARPLHPARHRRPGSVKTADLEALRSSAPGALGRHRQLARFLCGLASPATTRAKLNRHPLFGVYSDIPFQRVLESVDNTADTAHSR